MAYWRDKSLFLQPTFVFLVYTSTESILLVCFCIGQSLLKRGLFLIMKVRSESPKKCGKNVIDRDKQKTWNLHASDCSQCTENQCELIKSEWWLMEFDLKVYVEVLSEVRFTIYTRINIHQRWEANVRINMLALCFRHWRKRATSWNGRKIPSVDAWKVVGKTIFHVLIYQDFPFCICMRIENRKCWYN